MILKSPQAKVKGYILLDALAGLCIFSFAFVIYYGLIEHAEQQKIEAYDCMEAANLAQSMMEQLIYSLSTGSGENVALDNIQGKEGKFNWNIDYAWEKPPSLLRIIITVHWGNSPHEKNYKLETLAYVG